MVEDNSINISVKLLSKYLQQEIAINASFHFSHYKSMATISCHSNQSSFLIGTKNKFICPPPPVSQFILPPGQLAPRDILPPTLVIFTPGGASCPSRFILPPTPTHIKKILLCDVYYYLQHYNNNMQFLSINMSI